jgi:hypothetical protein
MENLGRHGLQIGASISFLLLQSKTCSTPNPNGRENGNSSYGIWTFTSLALPAAGNFGFVAGQFVYELEPARL